MNRIGIISGSGGYVWPRLTGSRPLHVSTPYGEVELTVGEFAGAQVVHLARHGRDHAFLSNQVNHRANLRSLIDQHVDCVVSLTVCGAADPTIPAGSLIAFDDFYFPGNRLPDGSLCTWHDCAGAEGRGHWIFDRPISDGLRRALVAGAATAGVPIRGSGCYGHVDGPRFNSRPEIAALRAAGVTAVSQTCGPEIVLAGEAEVPLAVLGYVTDHANGIADPQPLAELLRLLEASTEAFARVLEASLPTLAKPVAPGLVHRFGELK